MTNQANIPNPSHPRHRSQWSKMIIDTMRAEYPPRLSQEQQLGFVSELAQRLSTLREWERYDRNHLSSVTLKRRYQEVARLENDVDVNAVHVRRDGSIIAGCDDASVRVWASGKDGGWTSRRLEGHNRRVRAVQGVSDDLILSGAADGILRTWASVGDIRSTKFASEVLCLQVLPDGSVVTGHNCGSLYLNIPCPAGGWEQELVGTSGITIWSVQALPNQRFATADARGSVALWAKGATGEWSKRELPVVDRALYALQVLPDDRMFVGDGDGYIWEVLPRGDGDFETSRVVKHEGAAYCMQALPDGRIVSGGWDRKIHIWERSTSGSWHEEVLEGHEGCVRSLQVLPDGRIVSGGWDNTIRIWDGDPVGDGGAL